ncbi:MAG: carbohydrate ABC transporter substrate-binding protein [Mesorhizobium sp.]|nr:MAG: carbohydrate ABC transporter substrate-binding protein [Mesorhizobium sp.]
MEYLRTALAAAAAYTFVAGAAFAEPKTNLLHQWATGSDAQAIAKLGEMFAAKGGTWQQTSIAGHTANTLAKLRADVIVASGKICISHSTADWTDSTVFEVVVYGMDLDLFKKAFVEGDVEAMRSDGIVKAFEQFRTMTTKYMDPGMNGRDWDTMSHLVGRGEAAFHIMGDWTLGLLTAGGFKEGTDYVCAQAPTDWGKPGFILNSDSVVFFQQKDPDYVEGQKLLASTILSPEFQTIFNQTKGSIPARLDVDLSNGFNPCQQLSQKDLQASIDGGTLVRSMAHNMTIPQKVRGAIMDTVTEFVATPDMTAQDAASAMADAAEAQM